MMSFDELISNGQLTKAARVFAHEYYDSFKIEAVHKLLIERLADKCDEAIARQSVTSEEVAEAIGYVESVKGYLNDVCDHQDPKTYDSLDLAITALQAYQPTISKTETTSCEWCEKVGKYAQFDFATYTEVDGDKECEYAVKVNYCPNCGRRLEETP